jgi:hypothetical protein
MQANPTHISARFAYRPDLIPAHGSPLYDHQRKRIVPPTATVRVGDQFFTPKQIVYILHRTQIRTAIGEADPDTITLPKYILPKDGNPANIRAENLQASEQSTRWKGKRRMVESVSGVAVPREFLGSIPPEMMDTLGIAREDIDQ